MTSKFQLLHPLDYMGCTLTILCVQKKPQKFGKITLINKVKVVYFDSALFIGPISSYEAIFGVC